MRVILIIFALCISGSAHAVTASGTMGVKIVTSVLSLDPEKAAEFCAKNSNNPNCDVLIANDKEKYIRVAEFVAKSLEDEGNQKTAFSFNEELSDTEYPVRMLNFE